MFFNKMDLLKNLDNKPIESLEFSSTRYFMKYEKYNCSWSGYFFASRKGSLFVKVVDEVFREYYLKYKDYSTYFFIDMVLMMCKKYGLDDNALDNIHFADGDPLLPEEVEMVLECSAGRRCYEWTASIRLVAM